jgi:hypothetical protein
LDRQGTLVPDALIEAAAELGDSRDGLGVERIASARISVYLTGSSDSAGRPGRRLMMGDMEIPDELIDHCSGSTRGRRR